MFAFLEMPTARRDALGRRLYQVVDRILDLSFDFWYRLGTRSRVRLPAFPVPWNFLYSFTRGTQASRDNPEDQIVTYTYPQDTIALTAVGDTASSHEAFITAQTTDLLLHLGDLCYDNDTARPFQGFAPSKLILVPGCREMISWNYHPLWNAAYIETYFTRAYYARRLELNGFCVKIIVVHGYLLPGSPYYYDQIAWLAHAIETDERYKIICSHAPPYSVSRHGSDYIMQHILNAAGVQGKFDLYLSGHEHCYQHFRSKGTDYLVNGLGGKSTYDFYSSSPDLLKQYNEKSAVLKLTVSFDRLSVSLVNVDEKIIDSFDIFPRSHKGVQLI